MDRMAGNFIEKRTVYFEKPGRTNTEACLEVARAAAKDYGYEHLVVASTSGDTGRAFAEAFRENGMNLIVVTHSHGFKEPGETEFSTEARKSIESAGCRVYTGTMVTHSLDTAFSKKFDGSYLTQIVANSLRRLGEGTKVSCECVMMAADAGLVPEGVEVLAIAGTARGADTVTVIRSAASKRFLDLKVLEILAKPRV